MYDKYMVKTCTKCCIEKPTDLFAKKSKSKDGLSAWCKKCFADNAAIKYQTDINERNRKLVNRQASRLRARNYIWSILSSSECVDCGIKDPHVLEFDHTDPAEKSHNVAEMQDYSVERIKQEVSKCVVRCANCHKKRTSVQFGFWRSLR